MTAERPRLTARLAVLWLVRQVKKLDPDKIEKVAKILLFLTGKVIELTPSKADDATFAALRPILAQIIDRIGDLDDDEE